MIRSVWAVLGLLWAGAFSRIALADSEWPQFRGLGGRGISTVSAPATWDLERGTNVRWQTSVPGLGHASPIIWGDRVYVATAVRAGGKSEVKTGIYGDGDSLKEKELHQWRLLCLDLKSGQVVWDRLLHESIPRQERHTKASHCNSTPATDGQHVVAILGSEGLFGFDQEGNKLWQRDLGQMDAGPWDAPELRWGFASSPVLYEGVVYVQCDVLSEQFVAAFKVSDGQQIWRTRRQEVANWCTPAIAPEVHQLVVNGWKQLAGYSLRDGSIQWWLGGGGDIPVPAPLVSGDWAYFTSAHGKYRPLRGIRLTGSGDITPPRVEDTNSVVAWCHPRLGSYMQTPITLGGLLWSCDWQGVLTCVDAKSGQLHYSERLGSGGQAFTASGIAAKDRLYFASEEGVVYVVAAKPQFEVVATNRLSGSCLATPAAKNGLLLFRTTEKLLAFGN